jgi:hypothetical protein
LSLNLLYISSIFLSFLTNFLHADKPKIIIVTKAKLPKNFTAPGSNSSQIYYFNLLLIIDSKLINSKKAKNYPLRLYPIFSAYDEKLPPYLTYIIKEFLALLLKFGLFNSILTRPDQKQKPLILDFLNFFLCLSTLIFSIFDILHHLNYLCFCFFFRIFLI